jgi:unsaturated chondroitin disaccharide hydrolase
LTKNEAYKRTLIVAADSLSHLYNPSVGTILSWPAQVNNNVYSPHNTIIDNMMNLELLFGASKLSANSKYSKMAVSHANVTAKHQVRPDNTVYHVLIYDDKTGKALRKTTHQGFSDESVWARGQAWGIYGYVMGYRETANRKYLKIADKLAKAYLDRLSKDQVPFWDFDDPAIPDAPKDVSAASVVASAFLELSNLERNRKKKEFYRARAEKMLRSLSSPAYLSGSENDAFLLHSTGNKPRNREVDIPIIYADYYYIEALVRLKKILLSEMAGKQMP